VLRARQRLNRIGAEARAREHVHRAAVVGDADSTLERLPATLAEHDAVRAAVERTARAVGR
jgi:hypothetical protein